MERYAAVPFEVLSPKRFKIERPETPEEDRPFVFLRNFDEVNQQYSDLVVVVEEQKFYVSKWILSQHSDFFKAMLGNANFKDSAKSEFKLEDQTPQAFQYFMEAIMGDPSINDRSVEKVLAISDYLLAKAPIKRCENFLIHFSAMSYQKKYEIAQKYKLKDLTLAAIEQVKNADQLKVICPQDLSSLDKETMTKFLAKSLELLPNRPNRIIALDF